MLFRRGSKIATRYIILARKDMWKKAYEAQYSGLVSRAAV